MTASPVSQAAAAALLAAGLLGSAGAQTAAEAWPAKPVTLMTPFPAGAGPDAVLRIVAEKLGKQWNQRVLVDNRPGGGGFIAIDAAKRAPADGYTLLELDSEHLGAVPHLYKQRNFHPLETFEPVATLFRTQFMVSVSSESKWKSMADLVAAAKAEPGKLSYGSWGIGSPGHLGGGMLESLTGTQMQHVPYREMSQLFTTVASGDVSWSMATLPSSQGPYKAGKLRYLAIAAPKRIAQLPDVPTVVEAGGPAGFELNSFVVLVAPRGLPAAVRAKVAADVARVLAEPDVKARFDTFAFEPISWSPEEIGRNADAKSKTYGELIKRANITLE